MVKFFFINFILYSSNFFFIADLSRKIFKTDEHSSIATILNNMSQVYFKLGNYEKALEINQNVYSTKIFFVI